MNLILLLLLLRLWWAVPGRCYMSVFALWRDGHLEIITDIANYSIALIPKEIP